MAPSGDGAVARARETSSVVSLPQPFWTTSPSIWGFFNWQLLEFSLENAWGVKNPQFLKWLFRVKSLTQRKCLSYPANLNQALQQFTSQISTEHAIYREEEQLLRATRGAQIKEAFPHVRLFWKLRAVRLLNSYSFDILKGRFSTWKWAFQVKSKNKM